MVHLKEEGVKITRVFPILRQRLKEADYQNVEIRVKSAYEKAFIRWPKDEGRGGQKLSELRRSNACLAQKRNWKALICQYLMGQGGTRGF